LDEALASASRDPAGRVQAATRAEPEAAAASTPEVTAKPEESISEAVPDEADGFDWQEDVNELADGMAALSVEPKGTGYLGTTDRVYPHSRCRL
jgi:transcriptional regulatory protein GAL4